MMLAQTKRHISFRIADDELQRIDLLAARHKLTRTDYMIRTAIGELDDPLELQGRFDEHDDRLRRLEQFAFGT